MSTEQNPLLQLSAEKQQELVNVVESGNIQQIVNSTGLSRRQVLAIGVGLLGSAGAGGFAASEVIGQAAADASTSDSDGNFGLPGDRIDVYADGIDSNSLSTGEQEITNETLLIATLSSSQSISSDTVEDVMFDQTAKDERSEFDTNSYTFSPDTSGYYFVTGSLQPNGGTDGDLLDFWLRDQNDNIVLRRSAGYNTSLAQPFISKVMFLDSNKSYNWQFRNRNSSDNIAAGKEFTFWTIRSVFRS